MTTKTRFWYPRNVSCGSLILKMNLSVVTEVKSANLNRSADGWLQHLQQIQKPLFLMWFKLWNAKLALIMKTYSNVVFMMHLMSSLHQMSSRELESIFIWVQILKAIPKAISIIKSFKWASKSKKPRPETLTRRAGC